ncbi:FAD-binding oxidoreductase [Terricaulis silvestris]|uniref:D-lactate dehydrogenase (cytochrome) n=1 Tax=Terricaulis silvestris TaxID=2686094 RepID=A0A6I6MQ82_9CAUL|nr:FAD-linked oxidase C-terminal domain-containing protein [Terricaulis silvestris]QGZ94924.1 putative FAD-linked oxidoreductase [Terricaulis silvestris]
MSEPKIRREFDDAGDAALNALRERFGERLSTAHAIVSQHSGLEGHHASLAPDAVIYAESNEDVADAIRWCADNDLPVIAHGAGTSLEGHLSAIHGGVSLDLTRMNAILDVSAENLLATVQAGVTREQLNHHLRDLGLFFPIDPGANATLGGMTATRASGTNAVRYGTMRDNVLTAKVVLANGAVIETGVRAAKSSAGYDLTGLFVGSEGTLGVITEVTLRLYGIPEKILSATCVFKDLDGAVSAVIETIQLGLGVARIELLDETQVRASNAFSKLRLVEQPTLLLEFHGSPAGVEEQALQFADIAAGHRGGALIIARTPEERSRLWKARHDAYFAAKALLPGAVVWTTDVCVPIAALADSILKTRADIEAEGALATIVGHVGDGNYHVMFAIDPQNPTHMARASRINERMISRAIEAGGTCTGEHGIGIGKRDKLIAERGETNVTLMRTIKAALDPANILNPGKIFVDGGARP